MSSPEECAVCTQVGIIRCELCEHCARNGAPDTKMRWYCSTLCREVDHKEHANNCNVVTEHRNLLERAEQAAEVAQALFYIFLERTWAYDLSAVLVVRDQHSRLVAVEIDAGPVGDSNPAGEAICERYAGGWLIEFPNSVFGVENEDAKRALLASQVSVWAFTFMDVVVQLLFQELVKDIDTDIKEIVHYVEQTAQPLVQHKGQYGSVEAGRGELPYPDKDSIGDIKGVYQIKLKNGAKLALDLAGAQYTATPKTIIPWYDYICRWSCGVKYRVNLGAHQKKHAKLISGYECVTYLTVVMEQICHFNNLIKNSECLLGIDIGSLSTEHFTTFQDQKFRLSVAIAEELEERPSDLDDGSFPIGIIDSSESVDFRHPKLTVQSRDYDYLELMLPGPGPAKDFDWNILRKLIKMEAKDVGYREKKIARVLTKYRCVYQMPGDWRWVFLPLALPPSEVPDKCTSINLSWKGL